MKKSITITLVALLLLNVGQFISFYRLNNKSNDQIELIKILKDQINNYQFEISSIYQNKQQIKQNNKIELKIKPLEMYRDGIIYLKASIITPDAKIIKVERITYDSNFEHDSLFMTRRINDMFLYNYGYEFYKTNKSIKFEKQLMKFSL